MTGLLDIGFLKGMQLPEKKFNINKGKAYYFHLIKFRYFQIINLRATDISFIPFHNIYVQYIISIILLHVFQIFLQRHGRTSPLIFTFYRTCNDEKHKEEEDS